MARSKGTGGITRLEKLPKARCRVWRLEAYGSTGKRCYRKFRGTYSQAEEALQQFEEELSGPVSEETFREYAERWLACREVAAQTRVKENLRVRTLCLIFGDMLLSDIKRQDIQRGINSLRTKGGISGKPLSGATINSIFSLLRQILQEATYDGLLERNPADTVKAPKIDTNEKQALTIKQVKYMLDCLEMLPLDGHTIGIRLALLSGSRRGEIIGYQWGDIKGNLLYVKRSIEHNTGNSKEPKTENGIRIIPMLPRLENDLKAWKKQQEYRLSTLGIEQTDETPIVTAESGKRMADESLAGWWRRNKESLFGVSCTLHELRHTFITLLANSGANAQSIKSIAGWSRISMADVYVHTDVDADVSAIDVMSERLT